MHYSVLLVTSLLFVEADPTKLIDNLITERWKQEDVRPSARCDDYEFIRRLSLDLRGVISTSDEVRAFARNPDACKRENLIDRWLRSKACAAYQAYLWAEELIGKNFDAGEVKLGSRFGVVKWIGRCLEQNMPYDRFVTQLLTATDPPKRDSSAAILAYILWSTGQDKEIGVRSARVFLGTQMQCAECHNHPFDNWTQQDYKSMAAFFEPTRLVVAEIGEREMITGISDSTLDREQRLEEQREVPRHRPDPKYKGTGEGPERGEPNSVRHGICAMGY